MPDPRRDRYADAVRARRAELRDRRALLLGGHRAELRACLTAGRLAASVELSTALAALHRELREHVNSADRVGRAALPAVAVQAADRLAAHTGRRFAAAAAPAIRRVATAREVPDVIRWPPGAAQIADPVTTVLLRAPAPIRLPTPEPGSHPIRALVGGTWRVVLVPAAALPAAGLSALGGRTVLTLAVGLGLVLLASVVQAQRVAADRARLRRWTTEVVSTVRTAVEAELGRRVLELERVAGAELDEAVTRRRAVLDVELQTLAAAGGGQARG